MNEYVIAKYIRLSLDDNITDSLSIPSQRLLLDEHIESLDIPNATVLEFVDNGFTGANMERPAMQEMLGLVGSGMVNCIVTKDFSRFSRSAIESGYYIEQVFPLYRIRFISVSDAFDSSDSIDGTGGIEVAFKFLLHEEYSRDLSRKVRSAKRVLMQNGEHIVGGAIYGYYKSESGKWEPDGEAAAVVREIYRMALDGLPTAIIRDRLSAAGYPSPQEYLDMKRGKDINPECRWEARAVARILTNEQYIGTYVAGKYESKGIGKGQMLTDKSEWIMIPDSYPPIISKEDFAAVQEIIGKFKGSTTEKPVLNALLDESRPKRSRMVSGDWIAATPIYGYAKGKDGKWSIDGTAAGVVQEIYDMALEGMSCAQISAVLSESGYATPMEHIRRTKGREIVSQCRWTAKCVRGILKNIQYTGAFVSGKILTNYDTGKSYHTSESDWIIIPGKNPPIISKEIFDRVQEITASNRVKRKNAKPRDYLLRGKVKCGCCGFALAYDPIADPIFRCHQTYALTDAECHRMKVNVRELDEAVLTIIRKQAEVVIGSGDLSVYRKPSEVKRQIADCERQLKQHIERRQECYERFVLKEIGREAYQAQKDDCTAQIDRLDNQLALLRQAERDKLANQKAVALANEVLSESLSHRDVVDALIDKIHVFPGTRIEIYWKVADFTMDV